jgi:hypothetical protein
VLWHVCVYVRVRSWGCGSLTDCISPSGSQPVTVTSWSKSLKTKTSFTQTQQSACELRYDLSPSSTRPADPSRIVKAERFAFQLLPRFFLFIWRVVAAIGRLKVPSSSSYDSSSSSPGKLNLSNLVASAVMEQVSDFSVGPLPLHLPGSLSFPPWPFQSCPRFRRLRRNTFF